ncbi:hypothetical protein SprV_0501964700 [Sparganum proliferum]
MSGSRGKWLPCVLALFCCLAVLTMPTTGRSIYQDLLEAEDAYHEPLLEAARLVKKWTDFKKRSERKGVYLSKLD